MRKSKVAEKRELSNSSDSHKAQVPFYIMDCFIDSGTPLNLIKPIKPQKSAGHEKLSPDESSRLEYLCSQFLKSGYLQAGGKVEIAAHLNINKSTFTRYLHKVERQINGQGLVSTEGNLPVLFPKDNSPAPLGAKKTFQASPNNPEWQREALIGGVFRVLSRSISLLETSLQANAGKISPVAISTMTGILMDKMMLLTGWKSESQGTGRGAKVMVWNLIETPSGVRVRVEPGVQVIEHQTLPAGVVKKMKAKMKAEVEKLKQITMENSGFTDDKGRKPKET